MDEIQKSLIQLVTDYPECLEDHTKMRGFLADVLWDNPREAHLVLDAFELGVVDRLRKNDDPLLTVSAIQLQLEEECGLTSEAAEWTIASWAYMLKRPDVAQLAEKLLKADKRKTSNSSSRANSDSSQPPLHDPEKDLLKKELERRKRIEEQKREEEQRQAEEKYRKAALQRAEEQRRAEEKRRIEEQRKISVAKIKSKRTRLLIGCIVFAVAGEIIGLNYPVAFCIPVISLLFLFIRLRRLRTELNIAEGKIKFPKIKGLKEIEAKTVAETLRAAGFVDIDLENSQNLRRSGNKKAGKVNQILLNGKQFKYKWYDPDDHILITYHGYD